MNRTSSALSSLLGLSLIIFDPVNPVVAQITPDSTLGSQITNLDLVTKTQYINGGTQRGTNLFHSFREFNIQPGNAAYFTNPTNIRTIFSRVTGNNPSLLLGKLGVDGSANLFFINPRGIIFGKNASLDLQGSFIGSTASNIKFPDGTNFSAIAPQDIPLLTIDTPTPIGLEFSSSPGVIINAGNLQSGSNLSLISGTVVSSGKILTPQGDLTLVTVPQTVNSVVDLGATGKFQRQTNIGANSSGSGLSLPELVNYANSETGLSVDSLNRITLPGSEIRVNPGDIVISGESNRVSLAGRTATVLANNNLSLLNAAIGTKGDLNLVANNSLLVQDNISNPSIILAGKDLLIRGDRQVNIFALNHPRSELAAGRDLVLRSANQVVGDAHFWSGGSFRVENLDGKLGNLYSPDDPIIRSLGDVSIELYIGGSLHIFAGGSVNINTAFIIDTAPENQSIKENLSLSDGTQIGIDGSQKPTLDIRAGMNPDAIGNPLGLVGSSDSFFNSEFLPIAPIINTPQSNRADININELLIFNGVALLTNQYKPNLEITSGDIKIDGTSGIFATPALLFASESNLFVDSRNNIKLTNSNIQTGGNGVIKLLANDGISLDSSAIINNNSNIGNGTNINLSVKKYGGSITLENSQITTSTEGTDATAGDIKLEASNIYLSNGSEIVSSSRIPSTNESGKIEIIAKYLELANNSSIGTSSYTSGNANNISINVGSLSIKERSQVVSFGVGEGGIAGSIDIFASDAIVIEGLDSKIASNTFLDAGKQVNGLTGSTINISTPKLLIQNEGKISADAFNIFPSSFATGLIKINAETVTLNNRGVITSTAVASGNSGRIDINASESISLHNSSEIISTIFSESRGDSGEIYLETPQLNLTNGSAIAVNNKGSGRGGNIFIRTGKTNILTNSEILAENVSNDGGNIELTADRLLILRDGSKISTSGGTDGSVGDGGNIQINAGFIVAFPAENSDITTNAYRGNGGIVNITTNKIFGLENRERLTPFSDITAISEFGLDGNIEIITLGIDPARDLVNLPKSTVNLQVNRGCQIYTNSQSAEFYNLGKSGLVSSPDRLFSENFIAQWTPWTQKTIVNNSASASEIETNNLQRLSQLPNIAQFTLPCQTN